MDGRSSTSKPASPSPSSSTTDIKSNSTRPTYSSKLGESMYSSKLGDPKAGAAAAAAAPPARQPPQQQRAWTSNKNPITGRAQTPQQGNTNSQNKPSVTGSLREGQRVRITLSTGAEFEGTFNNGAEPTTCRLTMVQQKKLPNSADIANGAKRREQATMTFQRKEITDARVLGGNGGKADGKNLNGNRPAFRTDAAISNSRFAERPLQPWVPDTPDTMDSSLEGGLSSTGQGWDQFEVNNRLFGVVSDYDENIYTTTIDRNNASYKDKAALADRAVREINQSAPATAHVAEERIMDFGGAGDHADEEEKYSGVRRQDLAISTNRENKYTPPARRAPTGQATVKGAPVDPAIISSQLKAAPTPKQPTPKPEETKSTAQASKPAPATKPAPAASSGNKATEAKPATSKETATVADKADTKQPEAAAVDKAQPALATATVERDVLALFKNFASHQRDAAEKQRTTKAKQDKETKLVELKKFATSFKLSTPVPTDLIGIIAKDPVKQKLIQEKALQNAQEIAKQKEKDKEAAAAKDTQAKSSADQPALSTTAAPVDSRSPSRPSAPQHANAPSGAPNRHAGPRNGYNNQPHYQNQQYPRNNRQPQHLGGPQGPQQPGGLGSRLRSIDQHKVQNQHMNPHPGMMDMRIPPTGPANNADPTYGRRVSAMGPTFMGNKLNPNSSEFRPGGGFPQAFMPAGPSQGSSPRSSVNHIVEPPPVAPTPVPGQLIRRKTNAVDPKKCNILTHMKGIKPTLRQNWDDNDDLRPAYDNPPTWRQLKDEMEKADSTNLMTYTQYFEQLPLRRASVATPNPAPAVPSHVPPHQHQLPFHLQHGAQNMAPRQSPHIPPMPLHGGQHAHAPVPYSGPDDHRMMHSNSAQSFASPRMGQVPMAYPPAMNTPGQMQYGQPMMQPYINPAAPPMAQFRSFSNNGQFMPQQPHQMGGPMMVQQQFMGPNGMVAGGPQVSMYPHPHFIPPNAVPPQPMAGSNGFPSPGRPAAPMMASQGSHQGQPSMYMSPGMGYQQPAYPPQQPAGKFPGPRPQ